MNEMRENESVLRQLLSDFQKQQDYLRGVSGEPNPNLDNIIRSLKYFLAPLPMKEEVKEISLCPHCYCMTKNICGKCKKIKEAPCQK